MLLPPEMRLAYMTASARRREGKKVVFAKPYDGPAIRAVMYEVPDSCTSENSPQFKVTCEVDGVHFEGQSRRGASCVLARRLKEAGISDQPLLIYDNSGREIFRWTSLYKAAETTYAESAKSSLRSGKYVDIAERIAASS